MQVHTELLYVAAGGALGSAARYGLSLCIHSHIESRFPLGTLLANWIGCLLMGIFMGLLERMGLLQHPARLFLVVGITGGFTTFSSFSFESIALLRHGLYLQAAIYMALSLVVGTALTAGAFWYTKAGA